MQTGHSRRPLTYFLKSLDFSSDIGVVILIRLNLNITRLVDFVAPNLKRTRYLESIIEKTGGINF